MGGIGIVAPVNNQLGIFKGIFQQVIMLGYAQPPEKAVGMGGAPVPPFPACRDYRKYR